MAETDRKDPWERLKALPMGRHVEVSDDEGHTWKGTVVPRHELSGDRILPLKLENGYNVGLYIEPGFAVRVSEEEPHRVTEGEVSSPPLRPSSGASVTLLTTGGTIASRVDYDTGGVRPVKEEREILAFYPELERTGPVHIVPVFDRLSEDITPDDWVVLAGKVVEAFRDGARGVVVAHGTDTLGFTAAGLSFLLRDLPGPVVLVGAQRSPDRPSSDGAPNLDAAVTLAREGGFGEVVVLMHAGLSDDRFAFHRGTWVRKMHSSRRDAFESRNASPLGFVEGGSVHVHGPVRPALAGPPQVDGPIDDRAALLWFYPGLGADQARAFVAGRRGVVLAGTGLGHVASLHLGWIREATETGTVVAMTTQCLGGNADPFVYATGRELVRGGVLYLDDLLPETAYAKMLWALGHASEPDGVRRLLRRDIAGEFVNRHEEPLAP
ncbi:MAG TPA: Glu-tRNA(Gln) amidotransferase subunit GatD [Thermoplasmata archaeon]|nr:Glu-tRNA(Gln) amidotransferase subunit GatD [Thermoplasmata archaeon]